MGYILNDEQKDVVALAKEFADKEVAPLVKEYDISGAPKSGNAVGGYTKYGLSGKNYRCVKGCMWKTGRIFSKLWCDKSMYKRCRCTAR